jgi:alkaline phosphatase D
MTAPTIGLATAALALVSTTIMNDSVLADHAAPRDRIAVRVTHGVSAGGVTSDSAVIWSRADRASIMHVLVQGGGHDGKQGRVAVSAEDDYTGKIRVTGLRPDRDYEYKVWFSGSWDGGVGRGTEAEGRFHTAPRSNDAEAVTFAWGGDVAGQNVCRDASEGFPIFDAIAESGLDFFIGLGDMIYADGVCQAVGMYGNA